jgi:hypothetical protein
VDLGPEDRPVGGLEQLGVGPPDEVALEARGQDDVGDDECERDEEEPEQDAPAQ